MTDPDSFDAYLQAARAGEPSSDDISRKAFVNPFASTPAFIWTSYATSAVARHWEADFDETGEQESAAVPAAPPLPRDDLETIVRELQLPTTATPEELQRARRRFMWLNHPDRRPEIPAALANRRVAIANMLIDRALSKTSRTRAARA